MTRINRITLPMLATLAIAAQANTPPDVDDLAGMRTSSAERELEDRGYHHRKTLEIGSATVDYWWKSRTDKCIAVTNKDGHVKSVVSQNQKMCDSDGSSHSSSHGSSHGGKDPHDLVDVRASSGERELEDMGYDHLKTVTFGGGKINYWWNSRKDKCIAVNVNDGRFTAVTDQPDSVCDEYGKGSGSHHGGGGHGLQSLVGMRASSGEKELEDRGYKFKNSSKGDDRIWSNWWNRDEQKCITVVTMDGRYDAITDTLPADCGKD